MRIKIKYKDEKTKRVERIGIGDWIDLTADEDVEMKAGDFKLIPLGVAMKLPYGHEANIVPRSSTFSKFGIFQTNSFGVIDNSYCGDNDWWFFPAYATRDVRIPRGTRICQFRVNRNMSDQTIHFAEVTELKNKDRGGHGSTGM